MVMPLQEPHDGSGVGQALGNKPMPGAAASGVCRLVTHAARQVLLLAVVASLTLVLLVHM